MRFGLGGHPAGKGAPSSAERVCVPMAGLGGDDFRGGVVTWCQWGSVLLAYLQGKASRQGTEKHDGCRYLLDGPPASAGRPSIQVWLRIDVCMHTYIYQSIHIHTCVHVYIHTCKQTYLIGSLTRDDAGVVGECDHQDVVPYMHACIHTYMHSNKLT